MQEELAKHHAADSFDGVVHAEERDNPIPCVTQDPQKLCRVRLQQARQLIGVSDAQGRDLCVVHRRQALGEWNWTSEHVQVPTWDGYKMGPELADRPG